MCKEHLINTNYKYTICICRKKHSASNTKITQLVGVTYAIITWKWLQEQLKTLTEVGKHLPRECFHLEKLVCIKLHGFWKCLFHVLMHRTVSKAHQCISERKSRLVTSNYTKASLKLHLVPHNLRVLTEDTALQVIKHMLNFLSTSNLATHFGA